MRVGQRLVGVADVVLPVEDHVSRPGVHKPQDAGLPACGDDVLGADDGESVEAREVPAHQRRGERREGVDEENNSGSSDGGAEAGAVGDIDVEVGGQV